MEFRGKVVLVVDDESTIRHVVAEILGDELGVGIADGADGAPALACVEAACPALVLTDLRMPLVDGFELCRRLKAQPATRTIPVLAMSAGERRAEALLCGCDDFIAKPFDLGDLCDVVREWLRPGTPS